MPHNGAAAYGVGAAHRREPRSFSCTVIHSGKLQTQESLAARQSELRPDGKLKHAPQRRGGVRRWGRTSSRAAKFLMHSNTERQAANARKFGCKAVRAPLGWQAKACPTTARR